MRVNCVDANALSTCGDLIRIFLHYVLLRNDIIGALTVILDNAPYGPTVEEAKVRAIYLSLSCVT